MRRVSCVAGLAAFSFAGSAWAQSAWPNYPNNAAIAVSSGGNVGLGTANPNQKLHVNGMVKLEGSSPLEFNTGNEGGGIGAVMAFDTATSVFSIQAIHQGVAYLPVTLNPYGGNVGIGTANPQYRLAVNGVIGAKDVIVTNALWSDYVFHPGYRLQPLSEVSAYINDHGHLPEIPSEAEVKEKGVNVGEMQAKLLAKVEELTLHLIQQDKDNRELRNRLTELENRLAGNEPVR